MGQAVTHLLGDPAAEAQAGSLDHLPQNVVAYVQQRQAEQQEGQWDPSMANMRPPEAKAIQNPLVLKFEDVMMKSTQTKSFLKLTYTALGLTQLAVYRHLTASSVAQLKECSLPEQVLADWDYQAAMSLKEGEDLEVEVPLRGPFQDSDPCEILGLCLKGHTAEKAKWSQWYFLKFEPFRSGEPGTYMMTTWEGLMEIAGRKVRIGKIYSSRDTSQSASVSICSVCMERADTMVLPCRHLCLCMLCAATVRSRSGKCPNCRNPIVSLLRLNTLTAPNPGEHRHPFQGDFDAGSQSDPASKSPMEGIQQNQEAEGVGAPGGVVGDPTHPHPTSDDSIQSEQLGTSDPART